VTQNAASQQVFAAAAVTVRAAVHPIRANIVTEHSLPAVASFLSSNPMCNTMLLTTRIASSLTEHEQQDAR
jgi:hypothetical protein